jgi:hypothetical protein
MPKLIRVPRELLPAIPTLTERWDYGSVYLTNAQRRAALPGFLDHYNYRCAPGAEPRAPDPEPCRTEQLDWDLPLVIACHRIAGR